MSELLTKLEADIEARKQDRQEAYRKLALALLDGSEPSAKQAEGVLLAVGKSLDDLKADVATLTERRALLGERERLPGLNDEQREVAAKIDAEMQRWREAETAHNAIMQPLVDRLDWLQTEHRRIDGLKSRLFETAAADLKAEIKAIPAQQRPIQDALDERRKQLAELATNQAIFDQRSSENVLQMLTRNEAAQREADAANFRRQASEMKTRIEEAIRDLQGQLDDLVAREKTLYGQAVSTL